MARKRPTGFCHICGIYGVLSFEHVPPRAAFNDRPVVIPEFDDLIQLRPGETPRGRTQQRGMGDYTLCERCNNDTGSWYGSHFVDWCYQGMKILAMTNGNPSLVYLNYLFPLPIIKQVVVMLFSINGDQFREKNPELVDFVLNRERRYLPPRYRIYAYYNSSFDSRRVGESVVMRPQGRSVMTELSHIPFGYVMTFDSPPPDRRLVDITHFSRYGSNEFVVQELKLPSLPTHMFLPGDYRTEKQITDDYRRNTEYDRSRRDP